MPISPSLSESSEAILISGPRKGKFITVGGDAAAQWTPAAEALLAHLSCQRSAWLNTHAKPLPRPTRC